MLIIINAIGSLIVIGLILLLAFLLTNFVKKKGQRSMPPLPAACILLLLIELLAFECDVSFKSGIANLIALAAAFPTYFTLFMASRNIPQRWMRNAIGFTIFAPIGLVFLFPPILLFVGFILFDDISDSGYDAVTLNRSYECRTFDAHGMLATSYSVRLYRHWQFIPFIEHRVAGKWGDLDAPTQVSCNDVVTEYVQTHPEMMRELKIENAGTTR